MPYSHAHYAGDLVDGAYGLGLFGDVATELCIRTDGDEGLFASYSDVQFRAPGPGRGPASRSTCELVRVGTAVAGARASPSTWWPAGSHGRQRPGAAAVLDPPLLATTGDRHRGRPRLTAAPFPARAPAGAGTLGRRLATAPGASRLDTPGATGFTRKFALPGP